jgi:2-polyprenyl-3-methyl-5-hydroxy-6-metoxy-1,4-benzoquinol methylase
MLTKGDEIAYFKQSSEESDKHLARLGNPDFSGLTVLDMGCGQGNLCIEIAKKGASRVYGVDIDKERIEFANKELILNHASLKNSVSFHCGELGELEIPRVDVIISKDTFEHIIGLENVLKEMLDKLKPSGRLMVGFAPFYHTAYGDHKRTEALIPWGHLIFSEGFLLNKLNRKYHLKLKSIADLGLNKLSIEELELLINKSGLKIDLFQTNVGKNPMLKLYKAISKISYLRKYFTHNCYFILRKGA